MAGVNIYECEIFVCTPFGGNENFKMRFRREKELVEQLSGLTLEKCGVNACPWREVLKCRKVEEKKVLAGPYGFEP